MIGDRVVAASSTGKIHSLNKKTGKPVWFHCTYNHLRDRSGKPYRVIMIFTDLTEQKIHQSDLQAQIDAISRSQAVIEYELDGRVLNANENFQNVLGYRLDEIRGQPHAMFVDPGERNSETYRRFWKKLAGGEFVMASREPDPDRARAVDVVSCGVRGDAVGCFLSR